MTNKELIAYLRDSKGWPRLGDAAADRIEELEAQLRQEIKDKDRVDRVWSDNYAALEAKLAKAVKMLDEIEVGLARISGFFFDTFPRKEIRATLPELQVYVLNPNEEDVVKDSGVDENSLEGDYEE